MRKDSVRRLEQHGIKRIPDGWTQSRVKYLGAYINGYPFKPDDWGTVGRPILRIQDLSSANGEPNRFDGEIPGRYLVRSRDILISWSASLGVYRWAGEEAWLNQHIFKVSLDVKRVRDEFFVWLAEWFINEMDREVHGSTMQHLTADAFGGFPVLLPPHEEQGRIADYLDRETARLDALVAAKERVLGLLAEKRRALITRAVTRGLEPNVPLRDSGIPWLGQIPAHWIVTRLKFVAEVRGGITLGKTYSSLDPIELPYLRVANVQDDHLDLSDVATVFLPPSEAASCMLEAGDVLMNEGGDADKLGRGCVWRGEIAPCLHQNHVFSVRPKKVHSDWLNAWTSSEGARAYFLVRGKQSTNLASISATNIKELPILMPPTREQETIVESIVREYARIDLLRMKTERTIALIKERRAALIAAAVTGQLDIPGFEHENDVGA